MARDPDPAFKGDLLRRRDDVVWRAGVDYLVLARIDGHTVEVRGPGPHVWDRLEEPTSISELTEDLAERFGVDTATVHADLVPVLRRLVEEGFVRVLD